MIPKHEKKKIKRVGEGEKKHHNLPLIPAKADWFC